MQQKRKCLSIQVQLIPMRNLSSVYVRGRDLGACHRTLPYTTARSSVKPLRPFISIASSCFFASSRSYLVELSRKRSALSRMRFSNASGASGEYLDARKWRKVGGDEVEAVSSA